LSCHKGIKHLFALTMITEIGDVKRFAHPQKRVSWIGMDICAANRAALHYWTTQSLLVHLVHRGKPAWVSNNAVKQGHQSQARGRQARVHCHCQSRFTSIEQQGQSLAASGKIPEQSETGVRSGDGGFCLGVAQVCRCLEAWANRLFC
jgi:hypothetical protein